MSAPDASAPRLSNFLTDIIDADLAAGTHTVVRTRFPPEPNGFLHMGHAKSICLNFGVAAQYGGTCNLRFDDTNPLTESDEYVRSIQEDVAWLGFTWDGQARFASDYFDTFYELAQTLVRKGLAYVDEQSVDEIRAQRGSLTEPGTPSPWRDQAIEDTLAALQRMKDGGYPDGGAVLRARIDMASPNPLMRDPLLYRVRHASHHRTGDAWCIYPMYDFAHCLEDAIEGVTHSFCTLEFENNRELYDWLIEHTGCRHPNALAPPRQYEFARLNLGYTVMSKRKLLRLVEEKRVSGWDDPRMPTIAGVRRRGVPPEAVRAFAELVGVAKANSLVDMGKLEYCIRNELNHRAPRVLCVVDPLRVVLTNLPEGFERTFDAPLWPEDVPRDETRPLTITRELTIERDDFAESPPAGWHRLAPGREVRLRHAWVIRCDEVVRDENGAVLELRCSVDLDTWNTNPTDRKVRGVIHWVSADASSATEVRLYDRLFAVERPEADEAREFLDHLNPDSLVTAHGARVESWVASELARPDGHRRFQFERKRYFFADPIDSTPSQPVFNRIVTLKDSWERANRAEEPAVAAPVEAAPTRSDDRARPQKRTRAQERAIARERNPNLAAAMARLQSLGLTEEDADVLSADEPLARFVEKTIDAGVSGPTAAKWATNELVRRVGEGTVEDLHLTPTSFAAVIQWSESERITTQAARDLLDHLAERGGDPETLVRELGLERVDDQARVHDTIQTVLSSYPDELARYRAGKTSLLGFFTGHVLRALGAGADARIVRPLLVTALDAPEPTSTT
jgi:glutaminyl-tRNA synthetase